MTFSDKVKQTLILEIRQFCFKGVKHEKRDKRTIKK